MDTSISMNLSPKMLEQAGMNNDFVLMLEYNEKLMYGTWQLLGNKCFPAGKQALSAFVATWQYMWYEESCFLDTSVLSEQHLSLNNSVSGIGSPFKNKITNLYLLCLH